MLPKQHRLIKREDFAKTFSKGSFVSLYGGVSIKFTETGLPSSRIGFPIGKNFSKKAVERNRARRVLRAATFQLLRQLKPGFDIIVMIRPEYKNIEFKKVTEDLRKIFAKANLLT
ncbi:MAG: Ribonuclease P protein component [uncultured bacterium]|nr:MAG: Ribonuclease P protein component [uncultured bacterium]